MGHIFTHSLTILEFQGSRLLAGIPRDLFTSLKSWRGHNDFTTATHRKFWTRKFLPAELKKKVQTFSTLFILTIGCPYPLQKKVGNVQPFSRFRNAEGTFGYLIGFHFRARLSWYLRTFFTDWQKVGHFLVLARCSMWWFTSGKKWPHSEKSIRSIWVIANINTSCLFEPKNWF